MTLKDGRKMNLHPEAIKFRNDLQGVFSSFKEITLCGLTERFVEYLKNKNRPIKFITVYQYITKTTPPAWLFPYLCDFLSQEPYSDHPEVWEFFGKWASPVGISIEKIKKKVAGRKESLLREAGRCEQLLEDEDSVPYAIDQHSSGGGM